MSHLSFRSIAPMLGAVRTMSYPQARRPDSQGPRPFVTISRQAGSGGRSLAKRLVTELNAIDPGEVPWTAWDRELVQKVVDEQHLPASVVGTIEDKPPTWFEECLASLSFTDDREHPEELRVYHKLAATVRALAEMGRVVLVGRGAVFVTADLPGGIHLRLVAPEEQRIAAVAREQGMSNDAATKWVHDIDRARLAFYRRHWRNRTLTPENFTAAFNTYKVSGDRLAACVLPLIPIAAEHEGHRRLLVTSAGESAEPAAADAPDRR